MLRYIDSFRHYSSGDLSEKWHYRASASIVAGGGRRGGACLGLGGGNVYVSLTLDDQAIWTVGFAMKYQGIDPPGPAGTALMFSHADSPQLFLQVTAEGFVRMATGVVLGTSTQALHTNVWYYLETRVVCHASAGEVTVRVDGVPWLTLTGVNTQPTAGVLPNQIQPGVGGVGRAGLTALRLDDLYICDGQGGGTFTTFLGDCRVDALFPNADGTYTAWTPSAGAAHYPMVDEPTPNDDTDYVSETTAGGRDSYQLEPLPTMPNPEVLAVQALVSARKEDVDEIRISPLLVSGAVTSISSVEHSLTASYLYARDLWTADPNAGGVWTEAAVNSLQVGVERLA